MKISVITNGISQDYQKCCDVMNKTGVKYAELQEVFDKKVELLAEEEALEIKKLNEKHGIEVSSVTTHAFVGIGVQGIEVSDENYKKQMDLLKNGIKVAKIIGAKHVRSMCFAKNIVMYGYHGSDQWNAGGNKAWPKLIELYKPIAKVAEEENISLIVENGFNGMITSGFLGKKFIADLGSKNVSILWDPANALYVGDIAYPDAYNHLKGIMGHLHIKDMIVDPVESWADVTPIGRGQLSQYLVRIADALKKDGWNGFVSLENIYRPDGADYIDGYYIDIETLKEIFGDK